MGKVDRLKIPKHIAIIMDGNGRWAKKKGLPKSAGHKAGIKSVEEIIKASKELGVEILTLYTFSTENWKRPKKEIDTLMGLLEDYVDSILSRLDREEGKIGRKKAEEKVTTEGVRVNVLGVISELPPSIQLKLRKIEEKTANNKKLLCNLALNYGARREIVDACKKIAYDIKDNRIKVEDLKEENFADYLYTAGIPDPDLLIRTSAEYRISNFLLWQLSYSEIYITDKLWPDFRKKDLEKAILDYQKRDRRYGG